MENLMKFNYRADPILGGTLAYWLGKRGDRAMPRKRDIDPTDMPRELLSHVQLVEIVGERFRYRLIGTAIVAAFGREYTGTYSDEQFTRDRGEYISEVYRTARDTRRPLFSHCRYMTTKGYELLADRVYLPLSDDGITVNFLFAALTFDGGKDYIQGVWGGAVLDPSAQQLEEIDLGIPIPAYSGRDATSAGGGPNGALPRYCAPLPTGALRQPLASAAAVGEACRSSSSG
jgi:hypothetical protein